MTQPADVTEQVLSYIRHQTTKGPAGLAALMERTATDCSRCLEDVVEEQATFHYDQEWSVKEVLGHMLESGEAVNRDIARLAEDSGPRELSGVGQTSDADQPIGDLRQAIADLWSETIRLTASLSEEAGRKPSLEHPMFGPLTGNEWIAFQRIHAMDHIQQMEKVKAHAGYPKA